MSPLGKFNTMIELAPRLRWITHAAANLLAPFNRISPPPIAGTFFFLPIRRVLFQALRLRGLSHVSLWIDIPNDRYACRERKYWHQTIFALFSQTFSLKPTCLKLALIILHWVITVPLFMCEPISKSLLFFACTKWLHFGPTLR